MKDKSNAFATISEKNVVPKHLPIITYQEKHYFVDIMLQEFRTVTPPIQQIEFIRFDSEQGREMCRVLCINKT